MAKNLYIALGDYPKIPDIMTVRKFNQELYRTTQTLANIIWRNESYYLSISSIYESRIGLTKNVAISLLQNYYSKIDGQKALLFKFIHNLQNYLEQNAQNTSKNQTFQNIYDPENPIMKDLIAKTLEITLEN